MSSARSSTRQRLIDAALELFASQGVTETTTRQIAELAEVNEVTLFRHFGNKHGLLLAVIEDSAVFTALGESLVEQANQTSSIEEALKDYARGRLQALEGVPEFVRSVVGEAGQYPAANRQALGRGLTQANRYVAEYLATVMARGQLQTHFPPEKLASLLNGMLLGYVVIEFTSEFHELWEDREDFLDNLVDLFLHGVVSNIAKSVSSSAIQVAEVVTEKVADLPASLVHFILERAKKLGWQDYALAYVLFGAGLSPVEVVSLERSHQISEHEQHLLQVSHGAVRQVPVNQWIMGKRYGSYVRNPLTQWLKSRKDGELSLFLNDVGKPMSEEDLSARWQVIIQGMLTPEGQPPAIEQARQTWCVEMLMKGMNLEDLSILSGWDVRKLQPYARRAREKAALEQAIRLDRKV
ncbi:TetR/AcrR family transcriptional regulator [Argonema antarcticum]|uniref:TetR/AcrR family transcriptional regulator n=1 Tax=Argonema antarcticum TaxID=2942763 RepID=UPI0020120E5D|nr:TetR/AcrR family transcriptional regulator [Argonema antarcticum]MCL1475183.1 TetR/AcrR family transcriptional regulator [Argonema antarcticum A004/B2]